MKWTTGILVWWRGLALILTILLASIILYYSQDKSARCGFVMVVMAVMWVTEIVPLPVTALVPVFAFPLFGVLPTDAVCRVYLKDSNMMFMGGLMMAAAVENCHLHERLALFVILHVGQSPRLLSLGIMIVSSFLSMWISNTATAAMMVPIVDAVVKELTKLRMLELKSQTSQHKTEGIQEQKMKAVQEEDAEGHIELNRETTNEELQGGSVESRVVISRETKEEKIVMKKQEETENRKLEDIKKECISLKHMLFLSAAFSANTGGTGSPLGCGPNIILMGLLENNFVDSAGLNFATWMMFNVPGVILCALLGWLWLQLLFMYSGKDRVQTSTREREDALKHFLEGSYNALGPVTRKEIVVSISFVALVFLWVFRNPGFIPGWATFFTQPGENVTVLAATPVMLVIFLLFTIPGASKPANSWNKVERCVTWEALHEKVPWGIILLLGGGLALAEGVKESGLSLYFREHLMGVQHLPKEALQVLVCVVAASLTELASNTATASILLPILTNIALSIGVNPLFLLIPATACCAYAFMLPVATPGNAIVLSASGMTTAEMMRAGVVMNVLCILVTFGLINTLGYAIFDLVTPLSLNNSTII